MARCCLRGEDDHVDQVGNDATELQRNLPTSGRLDVIGDSDVFQIELPAAEVTALVAAAEEAAKDRVELHTIVRTVRDHFDADERIQMMEMLWDVSPLIRAHSKVRRRPVFSMV